MKDEHDTQTAGESTGTRLPDMTGKPFSSSWGLRVLPSLSEADADKEVESTVEGIAALAKISDPAFAGDDRGQCVYTMGGMGEVFFAAQTECGKFGTPLRVWLKNVLLWAKHHPSDETPEGKPYLHIDLVVEGVRGVRSLTVKARHRGFTIFRITFARTAEDYFGEFFGANGEDLSSGACMSPSGLTPWEFRELAPWAGKGLSLVQGDEVEHESFYEAEESLLEKVGERMTDLSDALKYDDEIFVHCMNAIGAIKDGTVKPRLSTYMLFMLACNSQIIKMRAVDLQVERERWSRYKFEFARLTGIDPLIAKTNDELEEVSAERIADARDSGDVVEPSSAGMPTDGAPLIDFLKSFFEDYIEDSRTFLDEMVKRARANGDEDGAKSLEERKRMFD